MSGVISVKNTQDGKTTPFSSIKLLTSLVRAVDHMENIEDAAYSVAGTVQAQLLLEAAKNKGNAITLGDIGSKTKEVLYRYDYAAYVKYASAHNLSIKKLG